MDPIAVTAPTEADQTDSHPSPGTPGIPVVLQGLIDVIPDPAFIKDADGRYRLANSSFCQLLSRPAGQVAGLDDRELFPSDIAERIRVHDQQAFAMGRKEQFQETLEFGGQRRTYFVTRTPFFDPPGVAAGLVCTIKDLQVAQATEAAEAERLTATIRMQEAIADPSLSPKEVMRRVIERTMDLLGGTGATVFLAEEDRLVSHAAAGSVASLVGGSVGVSTSLVGRAFLESAALRCHDAQSDPRVDPEMYRKLQIRSGIMVPLRSDLRTIGVLSVVHDEPNRFSDSEFQALVLIGGLLSGAIARARYFARNRELVQKLTETLHALSANEERFRSAVDAAGLAVWDWHLATGEMNWLGHYREVLGVSSADQCDRLDRFMQLIHEDDRPATEQAMRRSLSSDADYSHTHRIRSPDGSIRWIMSRGEFHRDEAGDAVRMVGALLDVTARRQMESQLLQAQKIEAIGQLAAGIAHEINTPIQYVTDNLRFLEDSFREMLRLVNAFQAGADSGATSALWDEIDGEFIVQQVPIAAAQALEGAERVAQIVRAMKEFSHPGREEMAPVDLNHSIRNTVEVSRNEWRYVAELELELDPGLPAVPCRHGEIQQVVLNLIVNAAHAIADARREGKGRILVASQHLPPWCEITVRDNGTGIPEGVRNRIFEPFFTTKEVGRGTGQGLALAHDTIVKKHGGTLDFATEVGSGTAFIIRLPLIQGAPGETW
jgi:PAS domain S-box-containing protein